MFLKVALENTCNFMPEIISTEILQALNTAAELKKEVGFRNDITVCETSNLFESSSEGAPIYP